MQSESVYLNVCISSMYTLLCAFITLILSTCPSDPCGKLCTNANVCLLFFLIIDMFLDARTYVGTYESMIVY